jgi:hypothetical protein
MSTLEVNKIIPQGSGTALQIAEASDTITIPSGATLDASAATVQLPAGVGGLSWESKTSNFQTAVSKGYFIDTSGQTVTATLPSSATTGDEIRFIDSGGNAATNNITVGRNGHAIQSQNSDLIVSTARAALGLIYSGATHGWLLTEK